MEQGIQFPVVRDLVLRIRVCRRAARGAAAHVPEGAELFDQFDWHVARLRVTRRRGRLARETTIDRGAERAGSRRLGVDRVLQLRWIARQVVQFRSRREDEFPSSLADAAEIAPAVMDAHAYDKPPEFLPIASGSA